MLGPHGSARLRFLFFENLKRSLVSARLAPSARDARVKNRGNLCGYRAHFVPHAALTIGFLNGVGTRAVQRNMPICNTCILTQPRRDKKDKQDKRDKRDTGQTAVVSHRLSVVGGQVVGSKSRRADGNRSGFTSWKYLPPVSDGPGPPGRGVWR
jgi:hypothetical protein